MTFELAICNASLFVNLLGLVCVFGLSCGQRRPKPYPNGKLIKLLCVRSVGSTGLIATNCAMTAILTNARHDRLANYNL